VTKKRTAFQSERGRLVRIERTKREIKVSLEFNVEFTRSVCFAPRAHCGRAVRAPTQESHIHLKTAIDIQLFPGGAAEMPVPPGKTNLFLLRLNHHET